MATDISIAIEKLEENKGWRCIEWEDDLLGSELNHFERNYALFGILANTKEDYEIIDENTTIGYIPISEPRGIPKDADKTQEYSTRPFEKDPYGRWYPSWVTLKEILEYAHWNKKVLLKEHPDDKEGIRVTYAERCNDFLKVFVPKLEQLTNQPAHLRIVFHFW